MGRRWECLFQSYKIISGFGQIILNFLPRCCFTLVFTSWKQEELVIGPLDFDWLLGEAGPILVSEKAQQDVRPGLSLPPPPSLQVGWPQWPFATTTTDDSCGCCTRCTTNVPTSLGFTALGAVWKGDTSTCRNSATTPGIHEPCKPWACVLKYGGRTLPSKSSNWGGFWDTCEVSPLPQPVLSISLLSPQAGPASGELQPPPKLLSAAPVSSVCSRP